MNDNDSISDIGRESFVTIIVVIIQVVIIGIVTYGVGRVFHASFGTSLFWGILIWAGLLFGTPALKWFFINVEPNMALILCNQLLHDLIPPDVDKRTKMFPLRSFREVGSGLRTKLPFERQFESVDLRSEIIIGNTTDKPLVCYTLDNIELKIAWQVILTPLRGYLRNLVRKSEAASRAYFTGQFEQAIIKWVKDHKEDYIFTNLDVLKDEFIKVFGGPDVVHDKEKEFATFTNTPQIISLNRTENYQRAAEGVQVGVKIAEIAALLMVAVPDADKNLIMAAANAIAGSNVQGLLLIPGFNDPKTFAAVTAAVASVGGKITGAAKGKGTP